MDKDQVMVFNDLEVEEPKVTEYKPETKAQDDNKEIVKIDMFKLYEKQAAQIEYLNKQMAVLQAQKEQSKDTDNKEEILKI